MMTSLLTSATWAQSSQFMHVYPLGLCGAPFRQSSEQDSSYRLDQLEAWIPHWQQLGVKALYLGPIFDSSSHGYDTRDFYRIDPRLGDRDSCARLIRQLRQAGIRVVLDGVFHHVGRDFWAFREVLNNPESELKSWFYLDHSRHSAYADPFDYACWEGHAELVKLNLKQPELRRHLFEAIAGWIRDFEIDGLRLDVAYALDRDFLAELAGFCRQLKPDFWLLGEIIHGDYPELLQHLDSVTNYECYKGLWSSHNDGNYFEIAHSLQRLFGPEGLCRGRSLYSFADNHDVDRVASQLKESNHLYPLYLLLYTMPGIPSLYYGSELGLGGQKLGGNDQALRPALNPPAKLSQTQTALFNWLCRLSDLRQHIPALQTGDYAAVTIRSRQFAFVRQHPEADCLIALNMQPESVRIPLEQLPKPGRYQNLFDGQLLELAQGSELEVPGYGGCLLRRF